MFKRGADGFYFSVIQWTGMFSVIFLRTLYFSCLKCTSSCFQNWLVLTGSSELNLTMNLISTIPSQIFTHLTQSISAGVVINDHTFKPTFTWVEGRGARNYVRAA